MAKLITPPESADQPIAVPAGPHGFSGKKVTVEFLKTNDKEARDIFVGVNDYQALIKRGTRVTIPEEVFDHLASLSYTDDDSDEDSPDVKVWVEKKRFPYNVISRDE